MSQKLARLAMAVVVMQQAGQPQTSGGNSTTSGGDSKKPKFCDKSWDETPQEGKVYFKFGNGTTLELDTKKLNDQTKYDLMCHGGSQKVGDSFAGVKGNYQEGIKNAQDVIDMLYAGEWFADREGGGPRKQELAEAIAELKGVPVEKARAAVDKATDDELKAWRSNAKVKAMITKQRYEKAQKALEASQDQGDIEVSFEEGEEQPA